MTTLHKIRNLYRDWQNDRISSTIVFTELSKLFPPKEKECEWCNGTGFYSGTVEERATALAIVIETATARLKMESRKPKPAEIEEPIAFIKALDEGKNIELTTANNFKKWIRQVTNTLNSITNLK